MPDLSRAVPLGNGVPLIGGPAQPPPIIMTGLDIESDLVTENTTGEVLPGLTFKFSNPAGSARPTTLVVDVEAMLGFPDALRRVIRDARSRAATVNESRAAEAESASGAAPDDDGAASSAPDDHGDGEQP